MHFEFQAEFSVLYKQNLLVLASFWWGAFQLHESTNCKTTSWHACTCYYTLYLCWITFYLICDEISEISNKLSKRPKALLWGTNADCVWIGSHWNVSHASWNFLVGMRLSDLIGTLLPSSLFSWIGARRKTRRKSLWCAKTLPSPWSSWRKLWQVSPAL